MLRTLHISYAFICFILKCYQISASEEIRKSNISSSNQTNIVSNAISAPFISQTSQHKGRMPVRYHQSYHHFVNPSSHHNIPRYACAQTSALNNISIIFQTNHFIHCIYIHILAQDKFDALHVHLVLQTTILHDQHESHDRKRHKTL